MNKIRIFLLGLAVMLAPVAHAAIAHVTTLSNSAATIIIPGASAKLIVIQNTGSNAIRLTFDGGSTYTDYLTGKTGTDPTTTSGYLLGAGQQLFLNMLAGDAGLHKPIRAIMVSGSTTLEIVTDEYGSTFPTS